MSLGKTHIRLIHHPQEGTIAEHFTVDLGVSEPVRAGDSTEQATARAIDRIYGDIARDFQQLLEAAFPEGVPAGDIQVLAEAIRAKLRGDPDPRPATGLYR